MSKTHTIITQYVTDAGQILSAQSVETDMIQVEFDSTVAATTTNYLINLAFPYANMSSYLLYSDQALTVYTNATNGAGGNSFTLAAGVPYTWNAASGLTNAFTANVTKFYANNAGSTIANFKIYVLFH